MGAGGLFGAAPKSVKVVEVGPRDGLQNEAAVLTSADKAQFIALLAESGLAEIEASSFVSPKRVPQLGDADRLFAMLPHRARPIYSALVPNRAGLERALCAGVRRIAIFGAASETFSQRNIGMTIAESLAEFREVAAEAHAARVSVRAYISTAFDCPYEGAVAPEQVLRLAGELLSLGADEISVGDTTGHGSPDQVAHLTEALLRSTPLEKLAYHFHDTLGMALANVATALQFGIAVFDAAAGGSGGCPFAPGASGNVATEDLLTMLHAMNIETGVDTERVGEAAQFLQSRLGRRLTSAWLARRAWQP